MNCTECAHHLHNYVDRELPAADTPAVEMHLAGCDACRSQLASLRALLAAVRCLPREIPPPRDRWADLRLAVEGPEPKPLSLDGEMRERIAASEHRTASAPAAGLEPGHPTAKRLVLRWIAPLAIAAAIALLLSFGGRHIARPAQGSAWSVTTVDGAPRVDAKTVKGEAQFRVGQWLETDATSRARVAVGSIGEVTLDPNSRLRLTGVAAADHRIELARGQLHALIWAPPRLFFVDTPSATAVDLGCAYTLTVDDRGGGLLHVTIGYVALEHGDRESIVPGGAMCFTRRGAGPGTPFADDASDAFRAALTRFDFERNAASAALPQLLTQARAADGVTLWHLLARTGGTERAAVFDTLARHHPPPEGVTRAGILAGDAEMRRAWGFDLGFGSFAFR
ncbi:MAG: zf-HC2 domain-containing protein [Verrucomicrobia bacterium]|nr:zf-HC2 domain-containing protein [Verrucomicrobiota bacterium]